MTDLRLPNITGKTDSEQLGQMKSYLHQLVQELNWALSTVEAVKSGSSTSAVVFQQTESMSPQSAEETFSSIKSLIIKSADIVKAYEDTILTSFNGKYFAESDFGTFIEQTNRNIAENSKNVTETYTNIQTITGTLNGLVDDVRTTNAYIKRGYLTDDEDGNAIYGLEVGETNDDGTFHQYARFTAEKLSFYDVNGSEVAYIGAGTDDKSDTNCLYVTGKAVFLGEIQLGRYKTDTSDGLAFTWIE